jgi:hypothetical protein
MRKDRRVANSATAGVGFVDRAQSDHLQHRDVSLAAWLHFALQAGSNLIAKML